MSTRFTVYLREDVRGWEWSQKRNAHIWWGFYRTSGQAKTAAKRSINPIYGKSRAGDWEFIIVKRSVA